MYFLIFFLPSQFNIFSYLLSLLAPVAFTQSDTSIFPCFKPIVLWRTKLSIIKCLDSLYCFYGYFVVAFFLIIMAGIHKYLWEIGPMSGELLFNRCCEIYFPFLLNTNRIKWHIENAQTIGVFRRSLPLELILDWAQLPPPLPPWVLQPTFFLSLYLIERKRQSKKTHLWLVKSLGCCL